MCERICKICGGDDSTARIAESLGFRPDIAFARVRRLEQLLLAVTPGGYDGITCHDVGGRNWFDARDELIGSIE